jgi:hypothetical protein
MSSLSVLKKTLVYSSQITYPGLKNLFGAVWLRIQMGIKARETGPVRTRREIRLVADTASDLTRVLPAVLVMVLPFYWTAPIIFRYAPGLIPKAFCDYDLIVSFWFLMKDGQRTN